MGAREVIDMNPIKPVFLLSLPRSGSTLLLRILGRHQDVVGIGETALFTHLVYALRQRGVIAEYNHKVHADTLNRVCAEMPNGLDDYYSLLRTFSLEFYGSFASRGETYFVDKTPSYTHIIDELFEIFDDAHFVCLWRNPLSIAASILETWPRNSQWLYSFHTHLYKGLDNLVNSARLHEDRIFTLQFEELVTHPEQEVQRLTDFLGIPFDPAMVQDFASVPVTYGDPTGVKDYSAVSSAPTEKWKQVMNNPVRKWWARRYLNWIGAERLSVMGYDLHVLLEELQESQCSMRGAVGDARRIAVGSMYSTIRRRVLAGLRPLNEVPARGVNKTLKP